MTGAGALGFVALLVAVGAADDEVPRAMDILWSHRVPEDPIELLRVARDAVALARQELGR